jgi:hypothetical protein
MRIESTFSPRKLCLDYKQDQDLLEFLCQEYLDTQQGKWYEMGKPSQKAQEKYNQVKHLLDMLK